MFKKALFRLATVLVVLMPLANPALGTLISHGSTSINMDFVTVGNPGNQGELSGVSAGGYGPDRVTGAVDYVYRIGKFEVSEAQWDAVVGANLTDPLDDPGYWSDKQPVAEISWHDAAMFVNWLTTGDVTAGYYGISGGLATPNPLGHAAYSAKYGTTYFLPTEDEWYKAAYYDPDKVGGAGYWDYPTKHDSPSVPDGINSPGDTFDAVYCAGYHQGWPNDVDNAGVLSAYGTTGQAGNVWEWNETLIDQWRGVRGGSFIPYSSDMHASMRGYDDPMTEDDDMGFRVAVVAVPEPGSIALWISGLAGSLILLRRHRSELAHSLDNGQRCKSQDLV